MLSAMDSNYADGHSSPQSSMLPPKPYFASKPGESHFVTPTSSAIGMHSSDHSKRGREDHSESSVDSTAAAPLPVQPTLQSPKKTRNNAYIAPRTVPNSFISSMGTLVAPAAVPGSNLRVHMRRELSGGKIESFLGDHDAMDVDTTSETTRPRSMSF